MDDKNEFSAFDSISFRIKLEHLMKDAGFWTSRGPDYNALAPRLNMTPVTLFRYLRGERKQPDINCIIGIASFFDVSTDWLLGLTEVPEKAIPDGREVKIITPADELERLSYLYSKASANDKEIVKCVLSKYEDAPEG